MAATTPSTETPRTRGHRKREKTRRQLVEAGLRVLAEKGEALTVSDVVAEADVSNGTFYNYFVDRDELVDTLAEELVLTLAETAASAPIDDPAARFAYASARVLERAKEDETFGRVVLRLVNRRGGGLRENIDRFLRQDLADGFAQGRFAVGATDAAVDQTMGLLMLTIRRLVEHEATPDAAERAVERALVALGVTPKEATRLTQDTFATITE